jgi:hypothetical protein
MMSDKFCVDVHTRWYRFIGTEHKENYFDRFYDYCVKVADENGWAPITVANYQLRPLGGRLIQTKTQGWYLRWDTEAAHTMFLLRWS